MNWSRFFLFLALLPLSLLANDTDYSLHRYLSLIGTCHLEEILPDCQGSVLFFGIEEEAIDRIAKKFPLIKICSLEFNRKGSWQVIIEDRHWENHFDCVVAAHTLEQESDREHMLRLIYNTLKPGKKGIILLTIDDPYSIDYKIEKFLRQSRWTQIIDVAEQLSFNEYRTLIERDFSIIREKKHPDPYLVKCAEQDSLQIDMLNWIGDRLDIPLCLRGIFLSDFLKTFRNDSPRESLYFSFNPWVLIIEK